MLSSYSGCYSHCCSLGDVLNVLHYSPLSQEYRWSLGTPTALCALCFSGHCDDARAELVSASNNAALLTHLTSPSLQVTSGYCPKTWEVSNSLTKTTAGNFCAGSKYSSMYSCAANCRYSSSQLQQAQCAGLPDKLSYTSGEQAIAA